MRGSDVSGRLALLAALAACSGGAMERSDTVVERSDTVVARYLHDGAFRRAELVASLVNPANGYSRLRLERYGRAWDELPEWNPRVALAGTSEPHVALEIADAARAGDRDALLALGRAAFERYPVQLFEPAFALTADAPIRYGLVGGVVAAEMADGSSRLAYTCATCHLGRSADGHLVPGLANAALDVGRLLADAIHGREHDPALLAWGPGRADVSTPGGAEPVRIPDLRPTRYQTNLQANATVAQRSLASLAIRIETLIVVGHGEVVRPPREVAAGLALYLWSLAPEPSPHGTRGRDVFAAHCARCHVPPSFAGPPVSLASIGADDAIGRSSSRGTGTWRVPSLVGVASRGLLFHDGSLADPADVLDPARLAPSYTGGRRPGAVTEHRFGLELDAGARADLLAYLRTL